MGQVRMKKKIKNRNEGTFKGDCTEAETRTTQTRGPNTNYKRNSHDDRLSATDMIALPKAP